MSSRQLATLSLVALLVASGCLGGVAAPDATTVPPATDTATPVTTTETPTATTEQTTRRHCSTPSNVTLSNVSKPATLSSASAESVAETIESRYQKARVDAYSYFNHHVRSVTAVEQTDDGYRVSIEAELDYDRRGGPNATVVHVHRPYTVTYRVIDRGVVRRGEAGTSGTLLCW